MSQKSKKNLAHQHEVLARVHQRLAKKYRKKEMAEKSKMTGNEAFGNEPKINTPQAQCKTISDSKTVLPSKGKGK
jgi:hypothetical protein